ncbi:hypothetical protein O9992_00865 [Vibrio lentus]|nr:hypothetical protein [Vibrio lentus]
MAKPRSARYRYDMRQNTGTTESQLDDDGDIVGVRKTLKTNAATVWHSKR